ncbi:sulfatase-like hydrolase/transferase [Sediminibacterium roseum]|uniref:Sulfatase-like hydrolase/transferase n=1 Tax=Sediminibacterium roseum TaxID=1978412 RepID=A0ABW9ZZZ9_9BACT|nr:sulfatase-like hydrolase/transferase [Sediminibacterium roseum]NCI51267.1 sulfatase-like hydrolase/transferase [Sediminibacterium roseum]
MNWNLVLKILFDLLTYGIFAYSALLLLSYILIGLFSIGETKKHLRKNAFTDFRILASSVHAPSVSILAPAYNEGLNIVENVKSLLSIFYSNLEVIIINDGSKDDSLAKLIDAYDLYKVDFFVHEQIPTKEVRGVYKSRKNVYHKLIVVDKVNGGKADALNVGINVSSHKYLVCIDVDCVLEQDALLRMIKPFLEQTDKRVIASGGVVRIANSCTIEDGRLVKVKLPDDYLPRIQTLEYIRAFILGRMAWTRLNGLMLISGAFGAFDKEIAIKCGGYDHRTVGEDMELVVRMRRYMEEQNEKYIVTYIPDPLCWTEAPATFKILGRQRNRWIRGTFETLKFHKVMFFNPRYHLLGMVSYPYWFFFELCAPLIEFTGFVAFLLMAIFGMLDWSFFITYFLFIICFGYLYSCFAILMEVFTYNQYKRRIDILRLMLTGLTEPFLYHPFVVFSAIKGFRDLVKKKKGWGEMTRQGLGKQTVTPPVPVVPVPVAAENTVVANSAAQPVAEAEGENVSLLERKIVPAASRFVSLVSRSFAYYLNHALVLLACMVVARAIELTADYMAHGATPFLGKVIVLALAKDLAFFLGLFPLGFLVFTLCYAVHKTFAHTVFIVLALVLLIAQLALSQYFIKTLVPLGADFWVYSTDDIRQTVGASGALTGGIIGMFVLFIAAAIFAFRYFVKRMRIGGLSRFLLFVFFTLAAVFNIGAVADKWQTGQEYSTNLTLNKSAYFWSKTYRYLFPERTDNAPGTGNELANDNAGMANSFNYIDEQHYPFLHRDSTADVLSPFFNTDTVPPNIVILLVEGLGRAFTNEGAYLGNFTPFLDSLSRQSLYWDNFLSEGGRTFAVLPSMLGSLPFARNGFSELGNAMPEHASLVNILRYNGYNSSFYYGGDSRFDNMGLYLRNNGIDSIVDEKSFPGGYVKMPAQNGFSWGYGDKELFRRYLAVEPGTPSPYLKIVLTVSTHDPFLINEQEEYLRRFETRMTTLGMSDDVKQQRRVYRQQFASILYADDAIRKFMEQYRRQPGYKNTVFLITGDHRLPEIPMASKIDRYHVPLIIYSPLLKRTAKFSSVSTHFDITPSLLAWLQGSHQITRPSLVSWMGSGLDTAHSFRNVHAYPIMQTKNDLVDFISGEYLLNNGQLFHINAKMELTPETDDAKTKQLKAGYNHFLSKNARFIANPSSILPDSVRLRFLRK